MASVYKQFLSSPNSALLADKATLQYVTTTTTFTGPTDIIKHLNTLQKQVKKKQEEVLNIVENDTSAVLEVDTTLEFITSGGIYLPGLDDNFVADHTAYLPIVSTNITMTIMPIDANALRPRFTSLSMMSMARSSRFASHGTKALF